MSQARRLLGRRVGLAAVIALSSWTSACGPQPRGDQPRPEYDPETGRLRRLEFDVNKNGRNDSVSVMEGTRIVRVEIDEDENGKVERWDFYDENRTLQKVGFSRLNDGVMDAIAYYSPPDVLARMEISTSRDSRFNKTEYYEEGVLVRSDEDTNGDGKPDKWETFRLEPDAAPNEPAYSIKSTAFDDTGRGTPNRRFVYGASGSIIAVEVDPDGDGEFVLQD